MAFHSSVGSMAYSRGRGACSHGEMGQCWRVWAGAGERFLDAMERAAAFWTRRHQKRFCSFISPLAVTRSPIPSSAPLTVQVGESHGESALIFAESTHSARTPEAAGGTYALANRSGRSDYTQLPISTLLDGLPPACQKV